MHSYYDLSTYIEGVELEIGDSDEVMSRNLEKLRRVTVKTNVFHTHIDYGIGVGSWTDNVGGGLLILLLHKDMKLIMILMLMVVY